MASFLVGLCLGIAMMLTPSLIKQIGGVDIPTSLIQTCGLLALAVAFFSLSSVHLIDSSSDKVAIKKYCYKNLLAFNLALTFGLVYAAILDNISYFGFIIHAPLSVAFALAIYRTKAE
ncbi:MAG: hypothetical protein WCN86_01355 [bacterium]